MEKEGIITVLKIPNNEVQIAVFAGLILIGIIILILGAAVNKSESNSHQQEFINKMKDKENKLKQREEKLNIIREQLQGMH
jgi:hypothetical protein